MRITKPFEQLVADMREAAGQLENAHDAHEVAIHLDSLMSHFERVQKMPKRLQFIYNAAAFVITELLYDDRFFENDEVVLDEDVIKKYHFLRNIIWEKYDR